MDNGSSTTTAFESSKVAEDEMNWDAYAEHYDVMCELNPSYQENIDRLVQYLKSWSISQNPAILDLGAGTGNYILALAKQLDGASYVHVDFDKKMNELARRKYDQHQLTSVQIRNQYVQDVDFEESSFDVIICINALYAISPQTEVLKNIHTWLKPDGRFFVIDFGRKQNILDWTFYVLRESMKRHRLRRYIKVLKDNRELIKQNRQTTKGQDSGRYWLHTTAEFRDTLKSCGFVVDEVFPCYRGYSDLAVCRKG
ncbi:MAG: class I SAM-dependent methyltransferase [Pseudomonadales bacterium]